MATKEIEVQVPEKLVPLIIKPKPLKIAVGGRGSGKTIAFSDCFLKFAHDGERVVCAREFQNSIEESVHSSLSRRIEKHDLVGSYDVQKTTILSRSGGKVSYIGLARNIGSIKGFDGVNKVWIEEGQYVSQESIDLLFPTIRENGSEIWVSMNRGSRKDPISKSFLSIAEDELARSGYYEDDYMIVVDINWRDNPWFPDKLDQQRLRDKELMDSAKYAHIWEGDYSDSVENAIIKAEWFDACVDAHKKLGFEPSGVEVVSHDPSDEGEDAKALCYRHGVVIKEVSINDRGNINEGCDWALAYAVEKKPDIFVWDVDGMGAGLKRQVAESLESKRTKVVPFSGAAGVENPDSIYDPIDGEFYGAKPKTNRDVFYNRRAQMYWEIRDRCFNTFQAVVNGKYHNPDSLISFDSSMQELNLLRSELCRIPRKDNGLGKIQLATKAEMQRMGIDSPNAADAVMMSFCLKSVIKKKRS